MQLSATAPLISLLNSSRDGPIIPAPLSLLPPPIISGSRIPALIPEANEPPLYPLLPVTKTFIASLQKSWKMKDAGGGISGSGETSSSRSMRLHHLLREMARKYDQYDDYMQQDAHELLRHLLDSMEMEEKDIIKRVQPAPTPVKKKHKHQDGISPLPSATPSPAPSAPASPTRTTFIHGHLSAQNAAETSRLTSTDAVSAEAPPQPMEIPEEERLVPFVDLLFGGLLASVVVCENCKSVS
jgi:ubiquitin carboxyl-terminal hydrolase 16/45